MATTVTAIAAAIFGVSVVASGEGSVGFVPGLGASPSVSVDFFPDVAVVGGASAKSRVRLRKDWNTNHAGGFDSVRVVPTVAMNAWPDGDYGLVRKLVTAELGDTTQVDIATLDPNDPSRAFVVGEAVDGETDVHDAVAEASKSMQHLVAMLDAKARKSPALVVVDRDASISPLGDDFTHAHVGRPEEFDSLLLSFLYKGPKKWDVLWCDKGQAGVSASAARTPALRMTNKNWVGDYDVYRWTGEDGMGGSGLYAVSGTFLKNLPTALRKNQFADANEWLARLCRSGDATCFSYLERKTEGSQGKLAARLGGVSQQGLFTQILWRDTTVHVGGASEASLGALMVGGESAGEGKALESFTVGSATELGKKRRPRAKTTKTTSAKASSAKTTSSKASRAKTSSSKASSAKTSSSKKHYLGKSEGAAKVVTLVHDASDDVLGTAKPASKHAKIVGHHERKEARAADLLHTLAPKGKRAKETTAAKATAKATAAKVTPKATANGSKLTKKKVVDEDDVDAMLDWWSDVPETPMGSAKSATAHPAQSSSTSSRSTGSRRASRNKTHKHDTTTVVEDAEVDAALDDALDAASASFLAKSETPVPSSQQASHRKSVRASHTQTRDSVTPSSETVASVPLSVPRGIETSPVLEREGDSFADDQQTRERTRLVSESVAKGDARDMRAASRMTDAAADLNAEGGVAFVGEGAITLHTISPEEALKHVSRVHHKEEVEAAEAAAELAKQEADVETARAKSEASDAVDRGTELLDAADESYADIVDESYADIVGERDLSWRSAVGEREAGDADEEEEEEPKEEEDDDKTYEDNAEVDYEEEEVSANAKPASRTFSKSLAKPIARSSIKSSSRSSTESKASTESKTSTESSAKSSGSSRHISRPPTLKRSPHATDVHAKHSSGSAAKTPVHLHAGSSSTGHHSERSTLGSKGETVGDTVALSPRAEARVVAKAAEARAEVAPAVQIEVANGGAWRSAFTEAQNQVAYATRNKAVFEPTTGPNAASLGATYDSSFRNLYGQLGEAELAALVAAADSSLDDFGPGSRPLAGDTEAPARY